MSTFSEVKTADPPEGFLPYINYYKDSSKNKLLLGIGAYRGNEGKPFVFPVVRKTDVALANNESLNKEYFIIEEDTNFKRLTLECLLGKGSAVIKEKRFLIIPWVAGASSLRLGAEFLVRFLGRKIVYYSKPCWESYILIFKNAGFEDRREYRYWSNTKKGLDIEGLLEDLNKAPEDSVVIIQTCGHNPTGVDPSEEQWRQIASVVKNRRLFPFLDIPFQGLVSGDLDKDAFAVRLFADLKIEFFCAQSFSKNMGIYNERAGNLLIVVNDANILVPKEGLLFSALESNFGLTARGMFIRPNVHGSRIATHILMHPDLKKEWKSTIQEIVARVKDMRKQLRENLEKLGTPGDWSHITRQVGMFCYLGINENQVNHLASEHHIHIPKKGHFAVAALNSSNIDYVSQAIHETMLKCS